MPVKSKVEILQNFVGFSEYMNFKKMADSGLREKNFREWVGFQKSYVIVGVGHGKCLRPITRWVGGVKKGQNNAYVIFELSLKDLIHYWFFNSKRTYPLH